MCLDWAHAQLQSFADMVGVVGDSRAIIDGNVDAPTHLDLLLTAAFQPQISDVLFLTTTPSRPRKSDFLYLHTFELHLSGFAALDNPSTMASEEDAYTFDFTRLPKEVGDLIARNFGTIRQLAAVRTASRSLESAFVGTTFKAVLFQDDPERVVHQLLLFCQLAQDEAKNKPAFRLSLCKYV